MTRRRGRGELSLGQPKPATAVTTEAGEGVADRHDGSQSSSAHPPLTGGFNPAVPHASRPSAPRDRRERLPEDLDRLGDLGRGDVERRDPAHDLVDRGRRSARAGRRRRRRPSAGPAASPSGSPVARSRVNSTPIISPGPRMSPIRSSSAAIAPRPGGELGAARDGVRDEVLVADRLEHGQAGRAGDRVAAVRRAVRAATPALLELAARDDRRQRQAVGDRLGHAHDVGDDPGVLERPHPPGPAVARLDLVGDEQDAVLVAQVAQRAQERRPAPGRSRLRRGPARSGSSRPSTARRSCASSDRRTSRLAREAASSSPPNSRIGGRDTARSRRPAGAARSRSGS